MYGAAMQLPRRLKDLAYPARGDLLRVAFTEHGRELQALVPDDEIFGLVRELVLQRIYDPLPAGTVIDAGAHVGVFSLLAAQHADRVVSLEPDPINFGVLELNVRLNKLDNLEPRCRALWTEPGEVAYHDSWHTTGGRVGPGGALRVQTATLDELVEELGPISLLKLDVEGAEEAVLPAATRLGEIDRIVAELHLTSPGEERPMVEALETAGFAVRLVPAADLYRARWARTILGNWRSLHGQTRVKLGVLAYVLAPVDKPRVPPGARDMPLLVAERR